MKVTVLGGSNIDITAMPASGSIVAGTSNPGRILTAAGGVGRNIAANLGRLGVPVALLSAVDGGPLGDAVLQETRNAGVDVTGVLRGAPGETGMYVAVHDETGDLSVAVSDMGVAARCDRSHVEDHRSLIERSLYLVIDANVPIDAASAAIEIAASAGVPVIAEPVSVAKAHILSRIEARIFAATPNRLEAAVVCSGSLTFDHLIVTRGVMGVAWLPADAGSAELIAVPPVENAQTSGAGDAFVAGLVALLTEGEPVRRAITAGIAAARLSLERPETTSAHISRALLDKEIMRCTTS
jgi:pseudouridine kinase